MEKEIELAEFNVMGISVTTTNKDGQSQKDIGELWQRFFTDNIASHIINKVSDEIYCVYTDYESNLDGMYLTIIGSKVSTVTEVPEGLICKKISAGKYLSFTSIGKLPDCVVATWQHIWQSSINRNFKADFDVYGPKSQDANNAEIETFVSIY